MSLERGHAYDPRTIAREVAGVFDAVFPRLVPGVVSYFNRTSSFSNNSCTAVTADLLGKSSLQRAMLFELAVVVAESFMLGESCVNWDACLDKACSRQRRYFDAQVPKKLEPIDKEIALLVANNLNFMLSTISVAQQRPIVTHPRIPGYRWIASGTGDFGTDNSIIEVKCSSRRFSTADYRQIVIYWLLSYIEGLERETLCWTNGILLNPRLNFAVTLNFDELVPLISSRRSSIEIVESFGAIFYDGRAEESVPFYSRDADSR